MSIQFILDSKVIISNNPFIRMKKVLSVDEVTWENEEYMRSCYSIYCGMTKFVGTIFIFVSTTRCENFGAKFFKVGRVVRPVY